MGLDNYPHTYPCRNQGTALVDEDGGLDCPATIEAGGCPWHNNPDRPDNGRVYGMFGTPCWYRGKHGNWLIGQLGLTGPEDDFYGTDDDHRPPDACRSLADRMETQLNTIRAGVLEDDGTDRTDEARYAIWWLRWTADTGNGFDAWW